MGKYKGKKITIDQKEYVIENQIGSGGNGLVFSARLEGDATKYAIKFLNIEKGIDNYSEKLSRFQNEINFCKNTDCKHIIRIYGSGEFEEKLCYVMRQYPKTLREVINIERDPFVLLNYVIQLCEALKYIHEKGVIHRDIKPENIFISNDNNLVLADFGIAHFNDFSLTSKNDWLGNKSYAAPEQIIKGKANDVTAACDIYASGVLINELFTGSKPSGSKFSTIFDSEPMLALLDEVVFRCMQQNPKDRPNIDEVICDIKLISDELHKNLDDITDVLEFNTVKSKRNYRIIEKAAKDILRATHIFSKVSKTALNYFNPIYFHEVKYCVSKTLKNKYFQELLYSSCIREFRTKH